MKVNKIVSIIILVTSITWGCNQSGSAEKEGNGIEQDPKEEPVQLEQQETPAGELEQQETPAGEADAYGREPGHEHYGHDHAPQVQQQDNQTNTQQETPSGEADKFGRKPGEEHYGHDHQ